MDVDGTLLESRSPLTTGYVRSVTRFAQPVSTLSLHNQTFVDLIGLLCPLGPHPAPRPYKHSVASARLCLISTIDSAMCWMMKSINDACRAFKATIWCGLLTIWTRYAVVSHSFTPCSNYRRFLVVSTRPVPTSGNVYATFKIYVMLG